MILHSDCAETTKTIARRIGEVAEGPLAILLSGDYGTGKTTFVQGLAGGLMIPHVVRSPSYNILKCYDGGRLDLVHADLYRMASPFEIDELGILEILPPDGILAVEWPAENLQLKLGMPCLGLTFHYDGPSMDSDERTLDFSWIDGNCQPVSEVLDALIAG